MRLEKPYLYLLACFCLAITIGCETVIEYDDSNFKPQLVINSNFAPDSTWSVYLTQTKSIFDGSTELGRENASVIIQDITANFEFPLHHVGNGVYETSINPQSGHVYHIVVDDEELGISHAIGKVPTVEHIEVTSSLVESNNSQYLNIEVNSSQSNNSDTYYAWQLVNLDETNLTGDGGGIIFNPDDQKISVTTRDFTSEDLVFVNGRSLNGNTLKDSIPSDVINQVINQGDFSEVQKNAAIKLVAISKELYDYYHTQDEKNQHQSSNTSYTPENYTNVVNGLGIFAGYKEVYIEL